MNNQNTTEAGNVSELKPLLGARTVLSEAQRKTIQTKVEEWTITEATCRAVEECNELADALLKFRRGRISMQRLKGEIADMRIVLEHMEYRYGNYQEELDKKVQKCA